MRKFTYPALFLVMTCGMAHAADPLGDWLVEDKVATIKIVDCNSRLWGVVSAEKTPGGTDSQNPDKTKRTRSTLGMPVLLNMKKVADEKDKWEGQIYNAKNGKTYEASIQLKSPNRLEVEGCVMSILCGGQTWTRAPENVFGPNTKTLSTSSEDRRPHASESGSRCQGRCIRHGGNRPRNRRDLRHSGNSNRAGQVIWPAGSPYSSFDISRGLPISAG